MDLFVLILSFFVMLFLGIPIAFALCLSSLLYMVLYSSVPLIPLPFSQSHFSLLQEA